jgi:PAS domain S-box-containing protein
VEGLRKDGSVFAIRLSLSEIKIADETFYCGLIEELEDQTATVTADDSGIVLTCNARTEQLFGYAHGELQGKNVSTLVPPEHATKHDEYIAEYKRTGIKHVIGKIRNLHARHKDGSIFPISLELNEKTEGGKCVFVAAITQITEQLEAHVTIDTKGIIRSLNRNLWVTFGYTEEELLGKNIKILMTHPHAEMHDTYLKRYMRTHKKRIIGTRRVLKAKHKDGSTFFITLEVTEFIQNGELMFGGKITRLLSETERKRAPEVRYIGNYAVTGILTDGLYGQVRMGIHHLTHEKVIIKTIEKSKIDPDRFREIAVMKRLRHPNVVRLLEVVQAPEKLYIVIQYIDGGELYDYAVSKDKLTEDEARVFWRQLVQGVEYMHNRGIVHRDLKLENIMLDKNKNVVIIDMGLSNFTHKDTLLNTFCGSSSYAAPEMFLCRKYKGPEVDIWSMGVILYCLVLGYLPFEDPQHIVDADFIPFEAADNLSPGTFIIAIEKSF